MFASTALVKEGIEGVVAATGGLDAGHLSIRLDAMFMQKTPACVATWTPVWSRGGTSPHAWRQVGIVAHEPPQTCASVCKLGDPAPDKIHDLIAERAMVVREVVPGILFDGRCLCEPNQ